MASAQLVHSSPHRLRVRHVAEAEVLANRVRSRLGGNDTGCAQSPDFRAEYQPPARFGPVQRLYTELITRQKHLLPVPVVHRDREHPAETLKHLRSPLLVQMGNQVGIPRPVQSVTKGQELPTQLRMVVELAVEDRPKPALLVAGRLMATCDVDKRKPPERQSRRWPFLYAGIVGSAVHHGVGHGWQPAGRTC